MFRVFSSENCDFGDTSCYKLTRLTLVIMSGTSLESNLLQDRNRMCLASPCTEYPEFGPPPFDLLHRASLISNFDY